MKISLPQQLLTLAALPPAAGLLLFFVLSPVEFISIESKDSRGVHMQNKILYKPGFKKDIWYMWQGLEDGSAPKDLLAIVVEGKKATFFQLDPNKSDVSVNSFAPISYRASCMSCHSNGPRALRPQKIISGGLLKPLQWVSVVLLNLRIKLYAQLKSVPYQTDAKTTASFHPLRKSQRMHLGLKSCVKCHRQGGLRAPLTNEQWWTAKHLVTSGSMPPWPYRISKEDKAKLLGGNKELSYNKSTDMQIP